MTDTAARMATYAEFLATYGGSREPHPVGVGTDVDCVVDDHCHIHHVDEPDNGDTYRQCLECCHVFVTELDLQAADVAIRTKIWQANLQATVGTLDHSGAPESRPVAEIESCPLCTHSF